MASKPLTVSLSAQTVSNGRPFSIEVSSRAYTARVWTVERRHKEGGPSETMSLTWDGPISGVQLWTYVMERRARGDRDFHGFQFLKAYPMAEGGKH